MKKIITISTTLALLASVHLASAGSHTWSGAVNFSWSNAGNWSAGGAPQFGEPNITLVFPASATRYAATNGVGNYAIDSIVIQGSNYKIGGYGITLTGAALNDIFCSGLNNEISLPMTLNSPTIGVVVGTGDSLTFSGVLSGPGGFTKFGRGYLHLAGVDNNTYTGVTTVLGGELYLNQGDLFNAIAIPGNLVLGDPNSNTYEVDLIYQRDSQIADTATVSVNPNCYYALQGHNDAIAGLIMHSGTVMTDLISPPTSGTLTLFGNVSILGDSMPDSWISGHVSLGGATRTFDVTNYAKLQVTAVLSDGNGAAGITKVGTGTLVLNAYNTYSSWTTVSAGIIELAHPFGLGAPAIGTVVQSGASLVLDPVMVTAEALELSGLGAADALTGPIGALYLPQGDASWAGVVALNSATITVGTNSTLTLSNSVYGAGLRKDGDGTLTFAGANYNTFTGGLYVDLGWVKLSKQGGAVAVPGPLTIGTTNQPWHDSYVLLLGSQQMPDNTAVTVNSSGQLYLNNFSQAVGSLNLQGGWIDTSNAVLTIYGDIEAQELVFGNVGAAPSISGYLSLGGANRTFHVYGGPSRGMFMNAQIWDGGNNAGFTKTGDAELALFMNSFYGGVTHINEGHVTVWAPQALGSSAAGTVVADGATLWLVTGAQVSAEPLTIAGYGDEGYGALNLNSNTFWGGPIVVGAHTAVGVFDETSTATINGKISGSGDLHKIGPGWLTLAGSTANTYGGRTFVEDGTLQLAKTNVLAIPGALVIGNNLPGISTERVHLARADQIADSADVTVNASGLITFDIFNAQSETIGSLAGSGSVSLAFATLTTGGNNADTTFSGTIGGASLTSLIKEGTGSMVLSGTNTCSGKMLVNNGHLYVNGSQTCAVQVSPKGHLHGQGTVGALSTSGGWTLPGDNLLAPSHGKMNSASLALDTLSHFNIDLAGTAASGKYNQLVVSGSVGLGQATLQLTQSAPGNTNDHFVIVKNNGGSPVNGYFLGLQEGALISISPSQQFQLTYQGGASGHDVVLTQLTAPPSPTLGGILKQGNGQIQIDGSGIPGWNYTVQANTNLNTTNWIAIGTALANGQGQFQFIDPDAPNHPMRFYRFLLP